MFARSRRTTAAVSLALLLSLVALLLPTPASAAGPADQMNTALRLEQYRLSNLPPTMQDLVRYNPTASLDELSDMYVSGQDKWQYQRQQAVLANNALDPNGNKLSADVARVQATQKTKFRLPATKPAQLVRTAANGATALTGYAIGIQVGNLLTEPLGIDAEGEVCTTGGFAPFLEIATGVNCDNWRALNEEYAANADVSGGLVGERVCGVGPWAGQCVTYVAANSRSCCTGPNGTFVSSTNLFSVEGATTPPPVMVKYSTKPGPVGGTWYRGEKPSNEEHEKCFELGGAGAYCTGNIGAYNVMPLVESYSVGFQDQTGPTGNVVEQSADPDRYLDCTILGTDGATYSAASEAYNESDGAIAAPVCPALPEGVYPANATITENTPTADNVLLDSPSTDEFKEFFNEYPECMQGGCTRELIKNSEQTSCFLLDTACDGWFVDPAKEENYTCLYSGKPTELDRCNSYRQTFNPELRAQGFAYSNPITGQVQLSPTAPSNAAAQLGSGVDVQQCIRDAGVKDGLWGMIFSPVRCSYVWAFIPNPVTAYAAFADFIDSWRTTPPGQLATIVASWDLGVQLAGCNGFPIDIDAGPIQWTGRIADACPGSMLEAWPQYSRLFVSALLIISGGIALVNIAASVFNMRGIGTETAK